MFETKEYTVLKIDGDYAVLELSGTKDTILVAMAFLPIEIEEGKRIRYENLQYTII